MSMGGGLSKESTDTSQTTTQTAKYQDYANKIMKQLYPQLQQIFGNQLAQFQKYGGGMSPEEEAEWKKYGTEGPEAMAAKQYIEPTMGQGWMQQLDPYFQAQRQQLQAAVPGEEAAFMANLKNQFGPAWGTSGRALQGASLSYGQLKSQQAQQLAALEQQRGQAAQQGMQYTGQMAPTYGQMLGRGLQWAGMPQTQAYQRAMQFGQAASPWSQQLMGSAQMGYQYPISTTGTMVGEEEKKSKSLGGGISMCWIIRKLYGLDNKYGKILFDVVNNRWPKGFFGTILNALYRKYGERIANYIGGAGVLPTLSMIATKVFFDMVYLFSKKS